MNRETALATSPEYYRNYIQQVPEGDVLKLLDTQLAGFHAFFLGLAPDKWDHRYADGKWSVREVVGHMLDVERIFGYRAMRISRGDKAAMPGFEENAYIAASNYGERDHMKLLEEFDLLRRANSLLLENMAADCWTKTGTASGQTISVGALAWILVGHVEHHVKVIHERYL